MSVLDEARDLIQKRLHDLDAERQRLERALHELGGSIKPSRGGDTAPKKRRKRRGAPGGMSRYEQVIAHIRQHPGVRTKDVAQATGMNPQQVSGLISQARSESLIKTEGTQHYVTNGAAPASEAGQAGKNSDDEPKAKAKPKAKPKAAKPKAKAKAKSQAKPKAKAKESAGASASSS